ncbi:MAG: hypothetical protein JWQ78_1675 [Sediminibacterium sp.]|nr:hypothetical protein [Sediminibacterium sp.]
MHGDLFFKMIQMKPINTGWLLLLLLAGSCQTQPGEKGTVETGDSAKAAQSVRTNMSFLNDFTALEKVFGNENWLLVSNNDSSYLYFSRLGNFTFNTYDYHLVGGDSANVKQVPVQTAGDKLVWEFDGKKLAITSATEARIVGSVIGNDSARYEFVRLDDNRVEISYPDHSKRLLRKTIPFSLFLIRSRYDHAHGTRYAFDSAQFNKSHTLN